MIPSRIRESAKSAAKQAARVVGRVLAERPTLARHTLEVLGTATRMISTPAISRRVLNAVQSWPLSKAPCLRPRRVTFAGDVSFLLQPHHGEFDLEALFDKRPQYEAEVFAFLASILSRYKAIVEIGANSGVYTAFISQFFERSLMPVEQLAFEPSPEAFRRLVANLDCNDARRVRLYNAAVGQTDGMTEFFEPVGHLTNGSLYRDFAEIFSNQVEKRYVTMVDGARLSALLVGQPVPHLLKIDVEGAEPLVVESMSRYIEDFSPDIIIEVLPYTEERLRKCDALAGYRAYEITMAGPIAREQVCSGGGRDWFLSRREIRDLSLSRQG